MKGVDGMIRLIKWRLDEKRRELADLENMRDELHSRISKIEAEMLAERNAAAASSPVIGFAYAGYAAAAMARRRKLEASIHEIAASIDVKKEEVADFFRELKKFEVLAERRMQRERAAEGRREQANLDEISLNMFRRAGLRR
jgi:flagellar FliJ protein